MRKSPARPPAAPSCASRPGRSRARLRPQLKAALCEHEGAVGVHLQPEFTGGVPRAPRSELLRREVDSAVKRAVVLAAVAEGVSLGRGWTRTYSPDDAPDLLTGPDALMHPERDQSGRQLPHWATSRSACKSPWPRASPRDGIAAKRPRVRPDSGESQAERSAT